LKPAKRGRGLGGEGLSTSANSKTIADMVSAAATIPMAARMKVNGCMGSATEQVFSANLRAISSWGNSRRAKNGEEAASFQKGVALLQSGRTKYPKV
jgi:hypothetical protein